MTWLKSVPIQLKTLGHIDLRTNEGAPLAGLLAQPKRLALLVYLASGGTRFVRRDTLLAMFWPESDDERARASLRKALHFIRSEAGDVIVSRGADEIGVPSGVLALDSVALQSLAAERRFAEALELYRGDFLPGFMVRGSPDVERWAAEERVRVRRAAAAAAWAASDECAAVDDPVGARAFADRAVALSPDDESAVRRYLGILADAGDRVAALVYYQEFAARLTAEYDVMPSAETRALVAELSTRDDDANVLVASPEEPERPAPVEWSDESAASDASDGARVTIAHATPVVEPTLRASAPPTRASWRSARWIRWGVAAAVAAIVGVVGLRMHQARNAPDPATSRVAVFRFLVRGAPELRYLADGLPVLLATRLDGAGRIRAVDPRALSAPTPQRAIDGIDAASAGREAGRVGSQLYVLGTVLGSPEALHLVVALYDRTRGDAPVARTEATGRESELASLVDRIAANLLAGHLRSQGDLMSETAARTTSSIAALKAWLAGETAAREGRYGPAIEAFDAAIAADSGFALAHFRRSIAANWAGRMTLVVPSLQQAVAHQDRLTPYTRTVVHAFLRYRTARYAEAESLFRIVVADHPTAVESWFELAEVLFHANPQRGRPITASRPAFERVLALDPANFGAQVHLARLAAARGDTRGLDTLSRSALDDDPDGAHRAELLLTRALALRDDAARGELARMVPDAAMIDALWRASEYSGDLDGARRIAEPMLARTSSDEIRASLRVLIAHLAMGTGQFALAEQQVDSLGEYAPHSAALTSVLLATHPSLPAEQRAHRVAYARAALGVLRTPSSRAPLYVGVALRDDFASLGSEYEAVLSLVDGDTANARRLQATPASPDLGDELLRSQLDLSLASDGPSRNAALRRLALRDTALRSRHSPSTPWLPRALHHLTAARVLAQQGRVAEARARLDAVPEDFGFNVAYLGAVRQARAALRSK